MYSWAANEVKLARAIKESKANAKANNKEATEDDIKALYVRFGGLVLATPAADSEISSDATQVEERPRHRSRKAE